MKRRKYVPGFVNRPNEGLYDTLMLPSDCFRSTDGCVGLLYAKQRVDTILRKIVGMSKEDFILFLGRHGVDIFTA